MLLSVLELLDVESSSFALLVVSSFIKGKMFEVEGSILLLGIHSSPG